MHRSCLPAADSVEPVLHDTRPGVATWVDPRTDPQPQAEKQPARATEDPAAIAELVEHCQAGRIYAVERWIASRAPLQVAYKEMERWRRSRRAG